jgi:C_GCAxxG_C_C family probable redox protein
MSSLAKQRALEIFGSEFNCAQSVYAGCARDEADSWHRRAVAAAFGGGVARSGEVCGALTGALMALGDARQTDLAADPAGVRSEIYARAQRLIAEFRAAHGSIRCRELTGCDMTTPEGQAEFKAHDLHASYCSKLVGWAAERASQPEA